MALHSGQEAIISMLTAFGIKDERVTKVVIVFDIDKVVEVEVTRQADYDAADTKQILEKYYLTKKPE